MSCPQPPRVPRMSSTPAGAVSSRLAFRVKASSSPIAKVKKLSCPSAVVEIGGYVQLRELLARPRRKPLIEKRARGDHEQWRTLGVATICERVEHAVADILIRKALEIEFAGPRKSGHGDVPHNDAEALFEIVAKLFMLGRELLLAGLRLLHRLDPRKRLVAQGEIVLLRRARPRGAYQQAEQKDQSGRPSHDRDPFRRSAN